MFEMKFFQFRFIPLKIGQYTHSWHAHFSLCEVYKISSAILRLFHLGRNKEVRFHVCEKVVRHRTLLRTASHRAKVMAAIRKANIRHWTQWAGCHEKKYCNGKSNFPNLSTLHRTMQEFLLELYKWQNEFAWTRKKWWNKACRKFRSAKCPSAFRLARTSSTSTTAALVPTTTTTTRWSVGTWRASSWSAKMKSWRLGSRANSSASAPRFEGQTGKYE